MPLSSAELNSIEAKAFDLINKCKIKFPPVDVEVIARYLGLKVVQSELNEVSGALIIEGNQGYIGYNPTHGEQRRRFTIAHEIGHYCLHCISDDSSQRKSQLFVDKDFIVKYRNANNYTYAEMKQEQQANAFAAALLMPEQFVTREIKSVENTKREEIDLIVQLATDFNVSVPAMTFRLENLNTLYK